MWVGGKYNHIFLLPRCSVMLMQSLVIERNNSPNNASTTLQHKTQVDMWEEEEGVLGQSQGIHMHARVGTRLHVGWGEMQPYNLVMQ